MSEVAQTVYLRLATGAVRVLDDLDVDSVALELDEEGNVTDFRLELGRGYEIVWLLPIQPNGYLRLIRIGYVTVDMDPQVLMDPCAVDFTHEWQGELGGGVEKCSVQMSQSGYRITAVVSGRTYTLELSGEATMSISKASAQWEGGLKGGRGSMKPAHAPEAQFSVASRFEGAPSSNPEELIGAGLAGCFSMALTASLERAGLQPANVRTNADVKLEKKDAGWTIVGIELNTTASVPGIDDAKFQTIAEETKKTCPVSRALTGTTISLKANLA